jgi:hypothetical protein
MYSLLSSAFAATRMFTELLLTNNDIPLLLRIWTCLLSYCLAMVWSNLLQYSCDSKILKFQAFRIPFHICQISEQLLWSNFMHCMLADHTSEPLLLCYAHVISTQPCYFFVLKFCMWVTHWKDTYTKNDSLRKVKRRFKIEIQDFTLAHREILHARLVLDKRRTK